MTLVLASVFEEGKLVLSDSRASSGNTSEDILQKIVGINKDIIVGYAGDVSSVNRALSDFQRRIANENISAEQSPEILKDVCSSEYVSNSENFALFLFTKSNMEWTIYRLKSPQFELELIEDIGLIGSGSVIRSKIVPFYKEVNDSSEDLQTKANRIIWHTSSLLASSGAEGVGGMIQALILLPDGVRTVHSGFIDMNPEGQPKSKQIRYENSRWVQRDNSNNTEAVIIAPNELLQQSVHERVFHNYERATEGTPSKWYLNSFLTAQDISLDHYEATFTNLFTAAGSQEFPQSMGIWVYLSFWGPSTEHKLELIHVRPDGNRRRLYTGTFDNEDFPMDYEFLENVTFEINEPGNHYLECLIDENLAGHKLIFVTAVAPNLPASANAFNTQNAHQNAIDERLQGSELTYFFIGNERGEQQPMNLKVKGQFKAVYTMNYPLNMHGYGNFGVRS